MAEIDQGARKLPGPALARLLQGAFGSGLTLLSIAWTTDALRWIGLNQVLPQQILAGVVALSLPLLFLQLPARKGAARPHVPWYDWVAAFLGLVTGIYAVFALPRLMEVHITLPADAVVMSAILVALCLEGLRRTVGLALLVVVGALVGYGLIGHLIPGALQTRQVSFEKLLVYLGVDTNGLFGVPMMIVSTIVIAFILFGQVLHRSNGGAFFNDLAIALMGRYRGGSAKVSITASSLFGSITGIVVSNIVATGVITIPLMKRGGYRGEQAAAIEAVASTGGQLMPPIMGVVAFFMAERLQTSYTEVVIAAIIPALLYYVALFIQSDLEAAKLGITAVDEKDIPRLRDVMRRGWPFVIPFAVIIVGLFWLGMRPESAALWGAVASAAIGLLWGYRGERMKPRDLWEAVKSTGYAVLDIVMIAAAAGFIIGALSRTGLGFGVTLSLVEIGEGNLLLLLLIAAVLRIVLGMGMPTIGVYLLLSVLIAPSLVQVGIDPMAAHMYIFYFGMMSMITPPLAIAAFFAASLAGANQMRTGFISMRFGWTAYIVPILFVFSPSLLMRGSTVEVALAVASAVAGVYLISVGFTGFLSRTLPVVVRAGFVAAGTLLLLPADTAGWWSDPAGFALGILLVGREAQYRRQAQAAAAE